MSHRIVMHIVVVVLDIMLHQRRLLLHGHHLPPVIVHQVRIALNTDRILIKNNIQQNTDKNHRRNLRNRRQIMSNHRRGKNLHRRKNRQANLRIVLDRINPKKTMIHLQTPFQIYHKRIRQVIQIL